MTSSSDSYRADIDGLRGVAVLSVILFHFWSGLLPGGFIGVDVFFVISGFLITRNTLQDLARRRFSFAEFYRRRIKRIAPAMLAVVLVTLVAAQLLMLPEDARTAAKSAVWSLASLANVFFWKEALTGYFAPDSREFPLLHLWSLGVEEQFYMLFPPLLALVYRPGRGRRLLVGGLAVAFVSFVMGDVFFSRAPSFVYYMLPTRAGELLLGGLAALAVTDALLPAFTARTVRGAAGTALLTLLASLCLVTENSVFPGWRACLPTGATAVLILAGQRDNPVSRLLAFRPLVWLGLISYSAYLWHWPLLAFYRYGYGEVGMVSGAILFAAVISLSWLTFRFVEQPARHSSATFPQIVVRQYVLPAGLLCAAALLVVYPERFGVRLYAHEYEGRLAGIRTQTRPAFTVDYVCQRQRLEERDADDPRCVLAADESSPVEAILWGDSNAAHYIGIVGAFAKQGGFRFRNIEIGSCPPIDGDPERFVELRRLADCRASLDVARRAVDRYPVVIISADWTTYQQRSPDFLQTAFGTITALTGRGKRVVLLGKVPMVTWYDRRCREKALSYPFLTCPDIRGAVADDIATVNARLRAFAARTERVAYYEVTPYLCPDGRCVAFDEDGEPRYYDHSHLTFNASWRLGTRIVATDGVPTPFAQIAASRPQASAARP